LKVLFLTREGCGICAEALEELSSWLEGNDPEGIGVEVEVVDIESDDELHRRFLERIPVIMVSERIVSDLQFDPDALESALRDE